MPIDDTERQRRQTLFHAHLAAENNFDLDRIMETFSRDTEMLYNKQPFRDQGASGRPTAIWVFRVKAPLPDFGLLRISSTSLTMKS